MTINIAYIPLPTKHNFWLHQGFLSIMLIIIFSMNDSIFMAISIFVFNLNKAHRRENSSTLEVQLPFWILVRRSTKTDVYKTTF